MERKKGRYHGESNLPKKTYLHYIGKKTIWFSSLLKDGIFFFIYERVVDPLPLMTYGLKLSLKA